MLDRFGLEAADSLDDPHWVAKINALLRYHYRIDPDGLTDDEWARRFNEYKYAKAVDLKNFEAVLKSSLTEIINQLFKQSGR